MKHKRWRGRWFGTSYSRAYGPVELTIRLAEDGTPVAHEGRLVSVPLSSRQARSLAQTLLDSADLADAELGSTSG